MSYTINWKVLDTKWDNSTGIIKTALIQVSASTTLTSGAVIKKSLNRSVDFEAEDYSAPEGMIALESVTETNVIDWFKDIIGDYGVASLEAKVEKLLDSYSNKIEESLNSNIETGLPWQDEVTP